MHLSILADITISPVDILIIVAYLGGVVWLGMRVGRGNQDLSDYLLGSRNLPWWALLGSIVATETSTATFLSVPGISYSDGGDLRFLQLALGYIIGRVIVATVLLPAYFDGQMYTAYEVLHRRFGVLTQRIASMLFLVARNLGDGLRLFLTAIALEAATGMPLAAAIAVIAVLTVFYTLFGGMKSVVWNDCVQLVVYVVGGLVTLWLISRSLPSGWGGLYRFAETNDKLRLLDFSFDWNDSLTLWAGVIGGAFLSIGTHGTDQMFVQRLLAAKDQRDAAKALVASGFVVFAQFALFLAIGIGLAAFFAEFPPETEIDTGDRAYARYIVDQMPAGLAGLALAAVFAAAMSTLSSSLNSSAAAIVGDFRRRGGESDTESTDAARLGRVRLLTVVFGVIQGALALGAARLSTSVVMDALAIAGFVAGVLLGVFALGTFTRRGSEASAIAGMIGGLAVLSFVKFETDIAWPWYAVIGSVTTLGTGLCVGLLCAARQSNGE